MKCYPCHKDPSLALEASLLLLSDRQTVQTPAFQLLFISPVCASLQNIFLFHLSVVFTLCWGLNPGQWVH